MAKDFKVISADDHVQEPPDLWAERLPRLKWGDRTPHVARQPDGAERWVVDSVVQEDLPLARSGALASDRYTDPQAWSQVPKAAYDPAERLKAMDRDGIDMQVLYPSAAGLGGEVLGTIKDAGFEAACVEAYNDWLLDVWAAASPRFVPQCLVPMTSIEAATKELERAVGRGHKGVVVPIAPWRINEASPHLYDTAWDPFWAKAHELGVPVCFHSGSAPSLMLAVYEGFSPAIARAFDVVRRPTSSGMVVGRFLFSGIGERFPELKAIFAAAGIDWVPFLLEVTNHEWARLCRTGKMPLEMDTPPADIFHRQCYVTTWFEQAGLRLRSVTGVDNILWGGEFPLETSTWPNSTETITKNFQDVPKGERDKILSGNAARLYKIAP